MQLRVLEHVGRELAIESYGVETRTRWQLLIHRLVRKLSPDYRKRRRNMLEFSEERYVLEHGLPADLFAALSAAECNVPDIAWFQVMEKPRILEIMLAAASLCQVFALSNFTAADRRTLFWSHDFGTIKQAFGYMLDDLEKHPGCLHAAAVASGRAFRFNAFALAELRELAVFLDMLLETE